MRNTVARIIAAALWLISMVAIFATMIHYAYPN